MAFLGKGAMVFWNDVIAEGEADFNHWHVFEHIPERVGVPGFLRGRRYVAVAADDHDAAGEFQQRRFQRAQGPPLRKPVRSGVSLEVRPLCFGAVASYS